MTHAGKQHYEYYFVVHYGPQYTPALKQRQPLVLEVGSVNESVSKDTVTNRLIL